MWMQRYASTNIYIYIHVYKTGSPIHVCVRARSNVHATHQLAYVNIQEHTAAYVKIQQSLRRTSLQQ